MSSRRLLPSRIYRMRVRIFQRELTGQRRGNQSPSRHFPRSADLESPRDSGSHAFTGRSVHSAMHPILLVWVLILLLRGTASADTVDRVPCSSNALTVPHINATRPFPLPSSDMASPTLLTTTIRQVLQLPNHDTCAMDAQCLNGGTCQPMESSNITQQSSSSEVAQSYQHCYCVGPYYGNRCEKQCPLTCANGGICRFTGQPLPALTLSTSTSNTTNRTDPLGWNTVANLPLMEVHDNAHPGEHTGTDNRLSSYSCKCLGYYTGRLCDIPYQNCADGQRCYYGGKCLDDAAHLNDSICECPADRTGPHCQLTLAEAAAAGLVATTSASNGLAALSTAEKASIGLLIAVVFVVLVGCTAVTLHRRWMRRRYFTMHRQSSPGLGSTRTTTHSPSRMRSARGDQFESVVFAPHHASLYDVSSYDQHSLRSSKTLYSDVSRNQHTFASTEQHRNIV